MNYYTNKHVKKTKNKKQKTYTKKNHKLFNLLKPLRIINYNTFLKTTGGDEPVNKLAVRNDENQENQLAVRNEEDQLAFKNEEDQSAVSNDYAKEIAEAQRKINEELHKLQLNHKDKSTNYATESIQKFNPLFTEMENKIHNLENTYKDIPEKTKKIEQIRDEMNNLKTFLQNPNDKESQEKYKNFFKQHTNEDDEIMNENKREQYGVNEIYEKVKNFYLSEDEKKKLHEMRNDRQKQQQQQRQQQKPPQQQQLTRTEWEQPTRTELEQLEQQFISIGDPQNEKIKQHNKNMYRKLAKLYHSDKNKETKSEWLKLNEIKDKLMNNGLYGGGKSKKRSQKYHVRKTRKQK